MVQNRTHGRSRGRAGGPRPGHSHRPKSYKAVCSACGREVIVQVPPPSDKKLLCMECFKK